MNGHSCSRFIWLGNAPFFHFLFLPSVSSIWDVELDRGLLNVRENGRQVVLLLIRFFCVINKDYLKNTTFVGVDLVSIQPDLTRIGETSLASRIQWVVGNFLKRLPFEDGEFDFVHVKRIARGVPENRWESLFDEITRVLKDGGAFEMVEEDLFFPGSVLCESKDDSSDEDSAEQDDIVTESTTGTAGRTDHDMSPSHLSGVEEDGIQSPQARQTDTNTSTETTSLISDIPKARSSMDVLRSRKSIYGGPHSGNPNETEGALFHPLINPISDPRDHSILEMVYNELHASRFINLQPLSLLSSMLVYHFKGLVTT